MSKQGIIEQPRTIAIQDKAYGIESPAWSLHGIDGRRRGKVWYQWLPIMIATLLCLIALSTFGAMRTAAAPTTGGLLQVAADAAAPTAVDAVQLFEANLAGAQEVPAVDTPATGRAVLSLISDTLHYRLFVADIVNVTASHIHEGAVGVSGGVVIPLFTGGGIFDPAHPISGTVTLTPEQIAKLVAGDYYLNVHTSAVSSGEIRGQIQSYAPPARYNALLLGNNEANPVATDAKGVAQFTLINTDTLQYNVAVSDIISVTASHIHFGPIGVSGPVVHALYTGTGTFDPENPISGTVTLDAKDLVDLLTGYFYVNVHTTAHSSGEIRGQIGGVRFFGANLSGAAETPPITSNGSGRAILALSADATTLAYRVSANDITDISASHIHLGAAGVAGPVIFPLFTTSSPGLFDAMNPVSGTIALSVNQVLALIDNDYYVNVHTPSAPKGAIRGQIVPLSVPAHMMAPLTGGEQVPAVDSAALGLARLTLNSALGTLHYSVAVTDITDISASHIHLGPAGQNGDVIFGLYNSSSGMAFDPTNPIAGAVAPTAKDWVDLLTGYHYINVHTSTHTGGEIRGQIGAAQLFQAALAGANEVPAVASAATGEAVMALNANATALDYRVMVANITDITASHIHKGAIDVSGGVVVPLYTGSGSFDPSHPVSGTIAMNTPMVFDLLRGLYYVNVHTTAHSSGEIRGQLAPYHPAVHYIAHLSGDQEVPPVTTTASGDAYFHLDAPLGILHYSISVTDVVSATASHIHLAPAGVSGGVIFPLFNANSGATLDSNNPLGGALMLSGKNLVDLLTAYYYVNVHTVATPSGEIRGQIVQIEDPNQLFLPIIVK